MQLSQKDKTFCGFFFEVSRGRLNFEHFHKKMNLIADVFPKLPTLQYVVK